MEASRVVGREDELAAVGAALAAGRRLLIEGDPGIGKTSLWQVGVERAQAQGQIVLACRPTEAEAELAYAALGDLFEPVLELVVAALPPPRRRALEVALLLAEGGGRPPDTRSIGLAVASAIETLAVQRPVLLAVDDAQWLDGASAAVLTFALRRVRVTVLAAARPGARALAVPDAQRIVLGPLSMGALHSLLHDRLG